MTAMFPADLNFTQLVVYRPGVDGPFNDWTDAHVFQGFAWREGSVSFGVPHDGLAMIEVCYGDEASTFTSAPARKIEVPFDTGSMHEKGQAEIGGLFGSQTVDLPSGLHLLTFSLHAGGTLDTVIYDYYVSLRFQPASSPQFRVSVQDAEMNFDGVFAPPAVAAD